MTQERGPAVLVLEDGRVFRGASLGAAGAVFGEVVFNTSMTGYQEIFTDPSYCGQIVVLCAPQVGNYGVCPDDDQAERPALSGIAIRELSPCSSGHRGQGELGEWLEQRGVVGICGIDTRALTRHIRSRGAMRAGIFQGEYDGRWLERVRRSQQLEGRDLASTVSTKAPYLYPARGKKAARVALLDFGVKRSILRQLAARGLEVEILPASTPAAEILGRRPAGVVLSNGPGDPAAVSGGIRAARELVGRLPVLGICLGHQLLALALGGRTFKLPFGHHGGNHPVRDISSGQVMITAQNHGFAVDPQTLPADDCQPTHVNLYDGTLEGFRSPGRRLLAVQFHPEASPGPSDAAGIFDRFLSLVEAG